MSKQIELSELQRRGEAILDELAREREPYVVARGGEPEAVLISYIEFLRLQPASDAENHDAFQRLLDKMDRLNSGFSEEEVARDVAEAIAEVRSER